MAMDPETSRFLKDLGYLLTSCCMFWMALVIRRYRKKEQAGNDREIEVEASRRAAPWPHSPPQGPS